jgi:hypothetical protein
VVVLSAVNCLRFLTFIDPGFRLAEVVVFGGIGTTKLPTGAARFDAH